MASPVPLDLVEDACRGNAERTEELIKAMWPDAVRLARAILGEDQPAQDAAQESCIILYQRIASLRSPASFRTWFYRIVVREASNLKRRLVKAEDAAPPATFELDHSASIDVWRALATLPHRLREVVVLRYFEDLSSHEIAAVLRIPAGSVRFRLMIARQKLRPLLDIEGETLTHTAKEKQIHVNSF